MNAARLVEVSFEGSVLLLPHTPMRIIGRSLNSDLSLGCPSV